MKQQHVPIHTEYIQIDQLLKLEGVIETGGQVKSLIDDQVLTLNGVIVTEKRKKCRVGDVIGVDGLDVEFIVTIYTYHIANATFFAFFCDDDAI